MNKKKVFILAILLCFVGAGFIYWDYNRKQENLVKPSADYLNDQDLLDKAQSIVEVSNVRKDHDIQYLGTDFVLYEVSVEDVVRGEDALIDQSIKILQTVSSRYPMLETDHNYLLFLDPYEGPIVDDAYVICGMSLGMLVEVEDQIVFSDLQKEYFTKLKDYPLAISLFKVQLKLK